MKDIQLPPQEKWHIIIVILIVAVIMYYALGRYQGPANLNQTVVNPLSGDLGASQSGAGSNAHIYHSTY